MKLDPIETHLRLLPRVEGEDSWNQVVAKIRQLKPPRPHPRIHRWRWALASSLALGLVALYLVKPAQKPKAIETHWVMAHEDLHQTAQQSFDDPWVSTLEDWPK